MHLIGQPSKKWTQLSTELICIRTLFSGLQIYECVFVKKHCILCSAQYNSQLNLTSQLYSRLNKQESSTSMYMCVCVCFIWYIAQGIACIVVEVAQLCGFSILQSDLVSNLRLKTVLCVGTQLTIKQCSSQQTGVCVFVQVQLCSSQQYVARLVLKSACHLLMTECLNWLQANRGSFDRLRLG